MQIEAEEMAQLFYETKVPDGRWKSIPQNAKDAYVNAIKPVIVAIEKRCLEVRRFEEEQYRKSAPKFGQM